MHQCKQVRPSNFQSLSHVQQAHLNAVIVVHASGQHAVVGHVQHSVAAVRTGNAAGLSAVAVEVPGRAQRAGPRSGRHLHASDGPHVEGTQQQ